MKRALKLTVKTVKLSKLKFEKGTNKFKRSSEIESFQRTFCPLIILMSVGGAVVRREMPDTSKNLPL